MFLRITLSIGLLIALAGTTAKASNGVVKSPSSDVQTHISEPTGDQITLKSGSILQGVRVLQSTPFQLVLEVLPTIDPLVIPARQVMSIKYGLHQPRYSPYPESESLDDESPTMLQAVKTTPELLKKLAASVTDDSLTFEDQDILNTLRTLGILSGVPITLGPRLVRYPIEERIKSVRLEPGTSFDTFITEQLSQKAPWIAVEFQYDRVHFYRKKPEDAAATLAPQNENESGGNSTGPGSKQSESRKIVTAP